MQKLDRILRELLERHRLEKLGKTPSPYMEPMLAMGSEGGRLVETVVRMTKPRLGLEVGTSSGFSALCAFRGDASGAFRLITIDRDEKKAGWARQNFIRAGVDARVEIVVMDALEAVKSLDGPFDYVLIDAEKRLTLPIFRNLIPKLNTGAVVLTDNITTHEAELREFTDFVRTHDDFVSSKLSVGNGIEMTIKLADRLKTEIVRGDI